MKAMRAMFNRLDNNNDGTIRAKELKSYMKDANVAPIPFVGEMIRGTIAKIAVDELDTDGNSGVEFHEFSGSLTRKLAQLPGRPSSDTILNQANKMFAKADKDSDGTLSQPEFQAVLTEATEGSDIPSIAKGVIVSNGADLLFPLVDINQNGELEASEMTSVLEECLVREESIEPVLVLESVTYASGPEASVETASESSSEMTDEEYNEAYEGDWWVESVTD